MKIQITKKHIKQGKKGRVTLCPIALACKECGFERVRIDAETFEIDGCSGNLPPDAIGFVDDFDDGKPVKPFTFKLTFHAAQ